MDRATAIWAEFGEAVTEFCDRWQVEELALFGSVLRDDFSPASDIDVLVRFAEGHPWTILDHLAMESELGEILGRRVEITSRRAVEESHNRVRRQEIFKTARTLYAA